MIGLETWKLISDGGLFLALIFLGSRFVSSRRSPVDPRRIRSLEAGLKNAVSTAERAGANLNKKLKDRQQSLEQLLFDLESVESRVNRAIDTAEALKVQLSTAGPSASVAADVRVERERPQSEFIQTVPEPPSFEQQDSRPQARSYHDSLEQRPAQQHGQRQTIAQSQSVPDDVPRNIYGEPIGVAPAPPEVPIQSQPVQAYGRSATVNTGRSAADQGVGAQAGEGSLVSQIEKEVSTQVMSERSGAGRAAKSSGIEDIYASAEELLRAGQALESVAAETRLPVEEVRMIREIITRENSSRGPDGEERIISDDDTRLGVLGGIKRTRQVL